MVLTATRYRTATGTGVLAAVLLILAFGNPWYVDWVRDNTNENTAGGWFLRLLAWPAWRFDSDEPVRDLLAADIKALLLIGLTALFLSGMVNSQLSRARGSVSQLLAGWGAYIFAAAVAGLLAAFIQTEPSLLAAFNAAGGGGIYGLFVGWIVGLAVLGGRRGGA
jgi:hypothetical protein